MAGRPPDELTEDERVQRTLTAHTLFFDILSEGDTEARWVPRPLQVFALILCASLISNAVAKCCEHARQMPCHQLVEIATDKVAFPI